jgi:CRISPR-associated endoribonuclease Cas6
LTIRQQVYLLAQLAFYSGVGYKTAMGLGQVRLRA